jgi:cyclohexanecarboxyl-CoA dehydrogenase
MLSGEKTSISFSDQADAIVLFARTGKPDAGARGISAFWCRWMRPASSARTSTTWAAPSSAAARCSSTTCACPPSHRLGDEGKGFTQVMQGFDYSRALIGLQCVGAAQASLDEAWAYMPRSARPSASRSASSRA